MKGHVMPSRVQMEPEVLQNLVAEVKETVAEGFNEPVKENRPTLTALNLWNIRRNTRFATRQTGRRTVVNPYSLNI